MKKFILLILIVAASQSIFAQINWGVKAGFGTSWIAFPKVYLVDTVDATLTNVWELAPATNSGTFYIGGEMIIPLGDHMAFRGELSYNYVSGEVNVDQLKTSKQARKLQAYSRIEVPLLFTVKSDDSFWFSLGPTVFFTISDNKGFEKAVYELVDPANVKVDSAVPIGIRARLAANIKLQEHLYLEVKFDYDLGKHFRFNEPSDTYEVRMAMQGITGGLTYLF